MKKIFFATLAVAALALSCQKNEVVVENPSLNQAIEFSTYSGKAPITKGEEMDLTKLRVDNFGVTAFYTGAQEWAKWDQVAPNFMYNQEIVADGENDWKYTPVKYWPTMKNDKISFFAYAPYAAKGNEHGITLPTEEIVDNSTSLAFEVSNDVAEQIDFVAAVAMNQHHQAIDNDATRGAVVFNFKHELTRLGFTVKLDESMVDGTGADPNYTADGTSAVVIKKVQLDGPNKYYASATYTWPTDASKKGTWTGRTWATKAFDFKNSFYTNRDANEPVWKGVSLAYDEPVLVIDDQTPTNLLKTINEEQEYFFLIPYEGGLEENASTVTIEYDIVTKDESLYAGYSKTPATKTVALPTGILQQGNAYIVNFTIYVDQIEVSATMEEWKDESKDVNVPYTPDSI